MAKVDETDKLTEREKVRGLIGRISGDVLLRIALGARSNGKNVEEMRALPYEDITSLIETWVEVQTAAQAYTSKAVMNTSSDENAQSLSASGF